MVCYFFYWPTEHPVPMGNILRNFINVKSNRNFKYPKILTRRRQWKYRRSTPLRMQALGKCKFRLLFQNILKLRVDRAAFLVKRNMSDNATVTTSYGKLEGGTGSAKGGRKYFYFAGVPYAEPPVGPLRFKPPVSHKGWDGVRSALKEGNSSFQIDTFSKKSIGNEDCLFLNIYTPQLGAPLKPVIVWIHGGAYGIGSGGAMFYGANFLMDHDVVLVTFNYRLGALGFLNLDLEEAAGNMGMKDQTLLLKWVQKEIHNFGGDPNNVTISGCSAGGSSVHYHMVSPLSKGLFHRAIAQSGTIPCEWAFMKHHYELSSKLGKNLGSDTLNKHQLLEFLMTVPAQRIVEFQNFVVPNEKHVKGNNWAFAPSIETVGIDKFLSSNPHELVVGNYAADVPFLTGVNPDEGFLIPPAIQHYPILIESLNSNFKVLFEDLAFPPSLTSEEISTLGSRVKKEYFQDEIIEYPKHFDQLVDLYGKLLITFPTILTLHHLKKKPRCSPIFYYKFSVDTPLGWYKQILIKNGTLKPDQKGVSHCDELGYLFSNSISQGIKPTPLAEKTITRMTKMWTNFAKTGDPSADVEWKPAFSSEFEKPMGLNIGEDLTFEPVQEFNLIPLFKELVEPSK